MHKQNTVILAATFTLVAAIGWCIWDKYAYADAGQAVQQTPKAPMVGSGGTFFGPTPDHRESSEPPNAQEKLPTSDVSRLWPHTQKAPPTEADRAQNRLDWEKFSLQYPANIFIPLHTQAPLTAEQEKAARQRLDDATAQMARQAAQQYRDKFSDAPQAHAQQLTEQQARDAGITPEQQKNYFNYKIQELESKVQLIGLYLDSSHPGPIKRAAAMKDMVLWKKELAELVQVRAQVPNS